MSLFDNDLFGEPLRSTLQLGGTLSPRLVDALYPMEALTKWHYANHIKGLTGRWMDGGEHFLTGVTRGSFHRLTHGHHLFEDGFRVLTNPDLKFGQFLHHLGMDALTTRGIPNPLLPSSLIDPLLNLGLPKSYVSELVSINLPKILGGSLSVVASGSSVYCAFSDAIPHTYSSAAHHLLVGSVELGLGLYAAPNVLLVGSGLAEIGVAATTFYRALVDPVLPWVNVPGSVLFPLLGEAVPLATLFGACAGLWTGNGWTGVAQAGTIAATASTASIIASLAGTSAGFLAPFCGPAAGIATALMMRQILNSKPTKESHDMRLADDIDLNLFPRHSTVPLIGFPPEPIGDLKGDRLTLDARYLSSLFENRLALAT